MRGSKFSSKTIGVRELLFYTAFSMLSFTTMLERSALVEVPEVFSNGVSVVAACLLLSKIVLDKKKRHELMLDMLLVLVTILIRVLGGPTFITTSCLAFLAMRDISIKTVIKIDVTIKVLFLFTHALLFLIDYITGIDLVWESVSTASKGTMVALYFRNPNTTGLIGTWIALDLLYLKDEKKIKDFIIPTIVALLTFFITTSRTAFMAYIVYLILQLIKNAKFLMILQKISYPLFCILTLIMVSFLTLDNTVFLALNELTSGRIGQSLLAFNSVGMSILPSSANRLILNQYTIDVFYTKCLVEYGIITLVLYGLPFLMMPKESSNESKRMAIVTCIYLFFERAIANIGFAMPFLVIADAIYNNKKKKKKKGSDER